jgi:hypothetical protein
MVYWVILLAVGVISLMGWQVLMFHRQCLMQFELDKERVWRQRVEVASKCLDADLRALFIQAHQHMRYENIFDGIFKAFDLYGRRANLNGREETQTRE